jgi:hypothetical protein
MEKTPKDWFVVVDVSSHDVVVDTPIGRKAATWRDMREAARDDIPDPDQIGPIYRHLLDQARAMAAARGLLAQRWEIPGVYVGLLGVSSEAERDRLLRCAAAEFPGASWPAEEIRIRTLDPDQVAHERDYLARAEQTTREIDALAR